MTIEEVARLEAKGQESLATDDVGDGLKMIDKNVPNGDLNTNNSYSDYHSNGRDDLEDEEEKVEKDEEKEGPDWSDWEDADQAIEEEIENELQQMSDESDHESSKVQTSPSPYRKQSPTLPLVPPMTVNWDCDVPESERDLPAFDNMLAAAESISEAGYNNNSSSSNKAVDESKTVFSSKSLKLTKSFGSSTTLASKSAASSEISNTARKTGTKGKTASSGPPKNADDLGAGLDIKSVEIKRTQPELDFFADMAPSIQITSKSSLPGRAEGLEAKVHDSEEKASINSKLFAVTAAPEEVCCTI